MRVFKALYKIFKNNLFTGLISLCIVSLTAIIFYYSTVNSPVAPYDVTIREGLDLEGSEPILALPIAQESKSAEAQLGERLFFEVRISNNQKSCASCHDISKAGINPNEIFMFTGSVSLNTPGMYNTKFLPRKFWTGKANSAFEQVIINFTNGMKITPGEVTERVAEWEDYIEEFDRVYEDGLTEANLIKAIVAYQDHLISPSRFDRYLNGDSKAISMIEKEGYELFKTYGCSSCHQGVNVGGNMFQRLGVFKDFYATRFEDKDIPFKGIDLGRQNLSNDVKDKYVFRVPPLRNVEITGPYLHDGSVETLDEAIYIMSEFQLGRKIPAEDVRKIKAFLQTLTGDIFLDK